jgi:hypothetical protein
MVLRTNKKNWVTTSIFRGWLGQWDKDLVKINKHILLILDNAPVHSKCQDGLRNIKIVRLPPNSTSLTQPLDAGIIKLFKGYYTKDILLKYTKLRQKDLPQRSDPKYMEKIAKAR